ncbi:hypothetical protein [Methanooceanicella nereidis]|nr:hypothetical protein [Methanocella sp. CWC-04]
MISFINDIKTGKKYVEDNSTDILRMNEEYDIGNAVDIALLMIGCQDEA